MARALALKNVVARAAVGIKLRPFISPLQEVANRCHISKRDQFWDQFLGPQSRVSLSSLSPSGGHAGTKLGPSISPLYEVANRAHVSKRDQLWDQFRGGQFWGLFLNRDEPH